MKWLGKTRAWLAFSGVGGALSALCSARSARRGVVAVLKFKQTVLLIISPVPRAFTLLGRGLSGPTTTFIYQGIHPHGSTRLCVSACQHVHAVPLRRPPLRWIPLGGFWTGRRVRNSHVCPLLHRPARGTWIERDTREFSAAGRSADAVPRSARPRRVMTTPPGLRDVGAPSGTEPRRNRQCVGSRQIHTFANCATSMLRGLVNS